jgi:hypothetical protein
MGSGKRNHPRGSLGPLGKSVVNPAFVPEVSEGDRNFPATRRDSPREEVVEVRQWIQHLL